MSGDRDFVLFGGNANPRLTAAVAGELDVAVAGSRVERFPDGEVAVELEASVRGRNVFLLQPTSPPVDEHLLELLALADACRRASARRIIAVVPYFGYARGDKRRARRSPVMASVVADLLQATGVQHLVTLDLHTPQVEGFFRIPVDSLSAVAALSAALRGRLPPEAVVVSPDLGGVRLATRYAGDLGAPIVLCRKRRKDGAQVEVTQIVGDVRDRPCLIVDDMITTGGTIVKCIEALLGEGARPEFVVAATHGVLVAGARPRLARAGVRELLVTDSISLDEAGEPPLRVVSVAPLLASALRRIAEKSHG